MAADFTAIATLITAIGSAVAAIVGAVNAFRGNKTAGEAKDLIRQVLTIQQTTNQANTQQQNLHLHLPAFTVGSQTIQPPGEVVFTPAEIPAAPAVTPQLPGPAEQPMDQTEPAQPEKEPQ